MFELRPYRRNNHQLSYHPFRDMEEFEKQFFSEPFSNFFQNGNIAEFKTDITDQGDNYLLEADLPGFDKKDIHLDLNGDTLIIHAERRSEHEEKDKKNKYICCERSYGQYSREFDVSMIDTDHMKAKYDNGVLKLTLPKKSDGLPEIKHVEID